jgi:hypothetical protein
MNAQLNKVETKVKALLAKANSTQNEHEAAAFAAKAHELLAIHNLDLAKIAAADDKFADVKVGERRVEGYAKGWQGSLATAVAKLYFCDVYLYPFIYKTRDGKSYSLKGLAYVGKEHNVEVAVSMSDYLVKTVRRLSKARPTAGQASFQKGCAYTLIARLDKMRSEAQVAVASAISDGSNLPALYRSESQLVDDFMKKLNLKTRAVTVKLNEDYIAGSRAAKDVSLAKQVHTSKPPKMIQ